MILQVNEIFESISGEAGWFAQGSWCTFVRLQGCNLHCQWCDTKKALGHFEGTKMSVDEIVARCKRPRVLITGGEPLRQQKGLGKLVAALEQAEKHIQIETNGSFSIPRWDTPRWVVDYKLISSGVDHAHAAFDDNSVLNSPVRSRIKFVIDSGSDLVQALGEMRRLLNLGYEEDFIASPAGADKDAIPAIARHIGTLQSDKGLLNRITFSLQLHKILNMP